MVCSGQASDAEFVVSASQVLDERVTADHHSRGPVPFQIAHRSQPHFQQGVVGFHPVVRVPGGVMCGIGQHLGDRSRQRR
jgi:hypothetical protein